MENTSKFISILNKKVQEMDWPVVMPKEFEALLSEGYNMAIIDVREDDDCCFSNDKLDNKHVYNIPFNSIVEEFPKHDFTSYDKIIMMCFAGPKGAVSASILRWMGNGNVYFLKGGVDEFINLKK